MPSISSLLFCIIVHNFIYPFSLFSLFFSLHRSGGWPPSPKRTFLSKYWIYLYPFRSVAMHLHKMGLDNHSFLSLLIPFPKRCHAPSRSGRFSFLYISKLSVPFPKRCLAPSRSGLFHLSCFGLVVPFPKRCTAPSQSGLFYLFTPIHTLLEALRCIFTKWTFLLNWIFRIFCHNFRFKGGLRTQGASRDSWIMGGGDGWGRGGSPHHPKSILFCHTFR